MIASFEQYAAYHVSVSAVEFGCHAKSKSLQLPRVYVMVCVFIVWSPTDCIHFWEIYKYLLAGKSIWKEQHLTNMHWYNYERANQRARFKCHTIKKFYFGGLNHRNKRTPSVTLWIPFLLLELKVPNNFYSPRFYSNIFTSCIQCMRVDCNK